MLAEHYRLTDEELDFITNHDVKFRMGQDAGGGENEEFGPRYTRHGRGPLRRRL